MDGYLAEFENTRKIAEKEKRDEKKRLREKEKEEKEKREWEILKKRRDATEKERKEAIQAAADAWYKARELDATISELGKALMRADYTLKKIMIKDNDWTFEAK